jgi:purine-binding chemotaxis protein CheW
VTARLNDDRIQLRAAADWKAVHRRLEAAEAAIAEQSCLREQDKMMILKARARALAVPRPQSEGAGEYVEIVRFQLASETYGIELRYVAGVSVVKELTPLPCSPAFVVGIVNAHGRVLSVVDLKRFFNLPASGLTNLNRLIVIQGNGMEFGVLADSIDGVTRTPRRDLQAALGTLTGVGAEYLKGITAEPLIVIDAGKLLSDPRIVVQQEPS